MSVIFDDLCYNPFRLEMHRNYTRKTPEKLHHSRSRQWIGVLRLNWLYTRACRILRSMWIRSLATTIVTLVCIPLLTAMTNWWCPQIPTILTHYSPNAETFIREIITCEDVPFAGFFLRLRGYQFLIDPHPSRADIIFPRHTSVLHDDFEITLKTMSNSSRGRRRADEEFEWKTVGGGVIV